MRPSSRPPRRRSPDDLTRATWRLGLQIGVLFLGCLTVVATIVVLTVIRGQQAQTISVLDDAIALSHARNDDDRDERPQLGSVSVAVSDPHGVTVDPSMPSGLPDRAAMATVAKTGVPDQQTVRIAGRAYAVRTARNGDDTVQAVLNLEEQREELARLLQAIGIAGAVGVLLSVAVSAWLARRAVQPIADALALQRRFVADASHELRTPLTLLSTRAQLLVRRLRRASADGSGPVGEGDATSRRALEADLDGLVADTANLTAILDELLVAADTRVAADAGSVDVAALGRDAAAAAEAYAAERGIQLSCNADQPAVVEVGNGAGLLRATTALLDNAISHARQTVQLVVRTDANTIVVEVSDDGPGIAPDVAPTMFERFSSRRAPASPSERRHYGLGLALVAEVADRHGGTVAATNRPDTAGAVLTMRLPRQHRHFVRS
jgi:two-component system, OmpR family, sensor kinase